MDKRLDGADIGLDCGFATCGTTENEVIQKVGDHIQTFHPTEGFSKEFYDQTLSAIHEGSCDKESPDELLCEACSGSCTC